MHASMQACKLACMHTLRSALGTPAPGKTQGVGAPGRSLRLVPGNALPSPPPEARSRDKAGMHDQAAHITLQTRFCDWPSPAAQPRVRVPHFAHHWRGRHTCKNKRLRKANQLDTHRRRNWTPPPNELNASARSAGQRSQYSLPGLGRLKHHHGSTGDLSPVVFEGATRNEVVSVYGTLDVSNPPTIKLAFRKLMFRRIRCLRYCESCFDARRQRPLL